jgi:hypothetical protein
LYTEINSCLPLVPSINLIKKTKYNYLHGKQAIYPMSFEDRQASAITSTRAPGMPKKVLSLAATLPFVTICGLGFGFTAGILLLALLMPQGPTTRDYFFFWATARQLTQHHNPYDALAMSQFEHSAGLSAGHAGLMRNPPWALPLIYPLGFLSPRAGWILWFFLLLTALAASVYLLWDWMGRQRNDRYMLGLSFAPAMICLLYGQTSLLILPGLVLFLGLYRTRPFLAGAALSLCALKPHLFLPFGVALLGWIAVSRAYKVLAGAVTTLVAACAITTIIDPLAWVQYARMAGTARIEREPIPCPSSLLRFWISPASVWLQFLPALLGCIWALTYYWPRRHEWDWLKNGAPLLLVSLAAAPYAWIYDHGVILPALLPSVFLARSRNLLIALAFLSALVEVALLCSIHYPPALYRWTIWAAPAWLGWYLVANAPPGSWDKACFALQSMSFLHVKKDAE